MEVKKEDEIQTQTSDKLELNDDNNIYYNCIKCKSLIEILSINEYDNTIEFKCQNKDNIIKIKNEEYLKNIEKNKNINLKDICEIHNNIYIIYCIDCKKQLCIKCLKSKNHIKHNKIIISELQPGEEDLKKLKNKCKK